MRNFFIWLLKSREEPFDITLFSFWHIFYALLIFGATIAFAVYLNKKDIPFRENARRKISYAITIVYIADFFFQPLFLDGNMNVDKLPFHICTLLCPVIAFTQFNKRFVKITEPVAFLSIVAPLMYIVYPGTAIGTESPFEYKIIQTFLFHALVFAWGFITISSGTVKPKFKNCYKALIGICMIAIWASLGNAIYSYEDHSYDWFFLTGSTFPFIPKFLMPFCSIGAVFAMVLAIYGIYYATVRIINKNKGSDENTEEKELTTV